MTTIATPPAAALDALLDRLSAGKPLTSDEVDLLRAGVTGLRRTAGGLQRRSQQQAARIAELEADAQAVLKREAVANVTATARAEYVAEQGMTSSPLEEIAYHAMGLAYRLDDALAAQQPPPRDRLAACPGCCPVPHACHLTRPQPTVWDQNGRVLEVEISGPIDRVAAIIAGALAGEAP
ncbi:hypothetical protein [Streptomyces albidoflavus]|uniref:hypothetical protein n=1 Tax=Streptomyces albidoflavus TaxID=1886 RepID=UPI0010224882|nr:hypothetical protein [Streptomyces albidoflavus]RZE73289.1 hypothetical protein C0R02_27525 [Streptomyces albidoflavus]